MNEKLKKYLVELIGTFFLVLTVSHLGGDPMMLGFILMVMVYAGGHISGGHYNPAVSLAACARGALSKAELMPYMVSQFAGAILAVLTSFVLARRFQDEGPGPMDGGQGVNIFGGLTAEFLFTFALCYVVLQVATTKKTQGNSYYGIAIGLTLSVAAACSLGGQFPGAYNPAVALSYGLLDRVQWINVFMTIIVNFIAGAFAFGIFKLTSSEE